MAVVTAENIRDTVVPVLLGSDMNAYSVARAFHEAYGLKTYAFGRYVMGETKFSRIVKPQAVPDIDNDEVMLQTMAEFAARHPGKALVLLGCTDDYAAMAIRNRDKLRALGFTVPYIDAALMDNLVSKESFYQYCEKHGIPYPKTVIHRQASGEGVFDALPFAYPAVLKPSSSIAYWKHPFEGMRKVYIADNAAEAKKIAAQIYASGYPDSLIVQDLIPGADTGMRVLTAYVDKTGKVDMMCLGHVMLEEHTPKAIGNHAAILTEYNGELMEKIKTFLEEIGYTGFANFDIKLDPRDNTYRVFEINLRQGRSNYYVTGAGLNIARYVVQDWLLNQRPDAPLLFAGESFWRSIPAQIVWDYTDDAALVKKAQALTKQGRATTALDYAYDKRFNPLRCLYLWEHGRRYYKRYAEYCKKREQ